MIAELIGGPPPAMVTGIAGMLIIFAAVWTEARARQRGSGSNADAGGHVDDDEVGID